MNCKHSYPGIRAIYRIRQKNLPSFSSMRMAAGVQIPLPLSKGQIPFIGDAVMVSNEDVENNTKLCECKLTFNSQLVIPSFGGCYIVECVDGECYIIGSDMRCATIKREKSTGLPGGEANVFRYTVSFKDSNTPLKCML